MQCSYRRSIKCAGTLLAILSLAACGGLPKGGERTASTAMKGNERTALAAVVRPRVAAHPGQSGVHALADAHDAIAARLVLADAARRSLDVQYFIWNKDLVGKVLLERLLRAADRGVRVRLLLDDLGTMPSDAVLLAIDSHPNIEVRMFNPATLRSPRLLGIVADIGRLNKRMHNKSFTADGQVSIVGGRNIGDEYFAAHEAMNYADLDVAIIGPRFRSRVFRARTRRLRSSPQSARRSSNIVRLRGSPNTRKACATASLPGSSGAETFRFPGGAPPSWTITPTRCSPLPRRRKRISRPSCARSSIKQNASCSSSRLTSLRGS